MKTKKNFFLFFSVFFVSLFLIGAGRVSAQNNFDNHLLLIKFKKDSNKIFNSFLNNFGNLYQISYQKDGAIANNQKGYFLFQINDGGSVTEKINAIKKDSRVKNAQPDYIFESTKKKKTGSGQDKFFPEEWWLYNNGHIGTAGSDIYLLSVWQKEQPTWPGVVVGIIDSGINSKHKDLKKNFVRGYDFVHIKKKNTIDKEGHGSFIAGLIASQVNNREGIAGISRLNHLKVMPLKFDFSTDEAISAIAYAQAHGVRILNASWGTNEYDQALYDAIKAYNGLVVVAAGNDGREHDDSNHFYPCDFDLDNVICVGASDENDRMTDYSDYGSTVDILAPGGSDKAPLISLDTKTDHYCEGVGTSFSTALVSGAAGLVLSANPSVSNLEIKNLLLNNARASGDLADKTVSGGILNVKAAVNRENPVISN